MISKLFKTRLLFNAPMRGIPLKTYVPCLVSVINTNTNTNTTELVWRPLQTKFGQGRPTIKNKNKNY